MPKHTLIDRSEYSYVATVEHRGYFIRSGSFSDIVGSTTGSVGLRFDAISLRLKRIEVFHSGAATFFNVALENSTPNTGSFFDPRDVVVCYDNIPGSDSFNAGIDQIEDFVLLTDATEGSVGNIYLKVMPFGAGNNDFKYLLFFEAAFIYVNKDGGLNG